MSFRLSSLSHESGPGTSRFRIVRNQPRNRLPEMLMKKVPQGKVVPKSRPNPRVTPQRSKPPNDDPSATKPICPKTCTFSSLAGEKKTPSGFCIPDGVVASFGAPLPEELG